MVTGVAGVSEGVVQIDEAVNDRGDGGYYYIHTTDENGNANVIKTNAPHCWKRYHEEHANLTLTQALAQSCNYYFCEVAYRMGIDTVSYTHLQPCAGPAFLQTLRVRRAAHAHPHRLQRFHTHSPSTQAFRAAAGTGKQGLNA